MLDMIVNEQEVITRLINRGKTSGRADDNVHFQNAAEYTEALVQEDKDFKENIYVNRNHGISGGNTRNHLYRQIIQWFDSYLRK